MTLFTANLRLESLSASSSDNYRIEWGIRLPLML